MVLSSFFQATRVKFVFDNEALVCPLNFVKYLFFVLSTVEFGNILFLLHLVKEFKYFFEPLDTQVSAKVI